MDARGTDVLGEQLAESIGVVVGIPATGLDFGEA
jgi:hypothetical protein